MEPDGSRALAPTRWRTTVTIGQRALAPRPSLAVRQHTLRPAGLAPLDSVVAAPAEPVGVLLYFPGFNTPLGPWEIAKCQYLAAATGHTVVLTEIPGMSRFHDPIPRAVRQDMQAGRTRSWAELNLAYIAEAMAVAGVSEPAALQVLGFSTGCSLATAALPELAGWGPVEGLNLVEPVAITDRTLAALQAHNVADLGRMRTALATNRGHDWVVQARRRQRREPSVHYSPGDLFAIARVLSSTEVVRRLEEVDLQRCALVRGERSSLCRLADYERLDALLARRGVPGPTITVEGLGHQLWHSFPVMAELARAMLAG